VETNRQFALLGFWVIGPSPDGNEQTRIKGEVFGIEGHDYVVQQFFGKEVRLMTDGASRVIGSIALGDSIEAKVREVDNRKHVLSIHPIK
jgi:hypothetical protein